MINTKLLVGLMILGLVSFVSADCSISLNSPEDNFYTTDQTPDFNYTSSGSNSSYICDLYINSVAYNKSTVSNNTAILVTANSSLTTGEEKIWYIYCQETNNVYNCTSATRGITIGRTNYQGMNSLISFIGDIIGLIPDIISLAIYGAILTVVGVIILWIMKHLKLS